MKILDLSAGNRAVWFNKNHPLATFLDMRPEMKPTIVCDTRECMAHIGDGYNLIVFDPPHTNCGANGDMAKRYGHFKSGEIIELIAKTSEQAHKVAAPNALMAFKWSDHSIKLDRALAQMPQWEPLFGHQVKNSVGTKHRKDGTKSFWVMLRRIDSSLEDKK